MKENRDKKRGVYFIGAGPGDPELISIKGKRLIDEADLIIYAGSLVNPEVLRDAKAGAKIYNSAKLHLGEVLDLMTEAVRAGQTVARVHTGDPSLYGAIREQMDALDARGISYEVVPGISSFLAAAAALQKEYTLPGVSQTLILTRMEGRTPVPEKESIEALARHGASMAIFLSIGKIEELSKRLQTAYPPETPAAVVYKASWEEQKILRGTLDNIAALVKEAGIEKTALTVVGNFLGDEYALSKLYDKHFSHEYRKAEGEHEGKR